VNKEHLWVPLREEVNKNEIWIGCYGSYTYTFSHFRSSFYLDVWMLIWSKGASASCTAAVVLDPAEGLHNKSFSICEIQNQKDLICQQRKGFLDVLCYLYFASVILLPKFVPRDPHETPLELTSAYFYSDCRTLHLSQQKALELLKIICCRLADSMRCSLTVLQTTPMEMSWSGTQQRGLKLKFQSANSPNIVLTPYRSKYHVFVYNWLNLTHRPSDINENSESDSSEY
jgi:hypothetical protein